MAHLSRVVVPGRPHHVTQRGVHSMNVFHSEVDSREYIGMLGRPGRQRKQLLKKNGVVSSSPPQIPIFPRRAAREWYNIGMEVSR